MVAIASSVVGAVIAGLLFGESMKSVAFLGEMFLNALKMVVVPLVMTSVIMGISALGDVRKLGRVGTGTLLYYTATTFLAVVTGLVLVNLIEPGIGQDVAGVTVPERVQGKDFHIVDVLSGLVAPNLFQAMAETDVLPIIVFSLVFGGILTTLGERGTRVLAVIDGLNEAFMKLVHLIMWLAPLGIFALVGSRLGAAVAVGTFYDEMARLGGYFLTVLAGLAVHGLVTLPLLLIWLARRNPLRYAANLGQVLITAFGTASSSATLPLTIEESRTKNGISAQSSSFVLPLGATVNMDGTALYEAVAAVFIAQAYGISLGVGDQLVIILTATLASIGAAGIPEAGLVTMIIVLRAAGLPLEGIGLLLAVDWLLDRFRTTVNVWGDTVGAAIIDRYTGWGKRI
jgi:Na+/H+-dicarboxylate symporter